MIRLRYDRTSSGPFPLSPYKIAHEVHGVALSASSRFGSLRKGRHPSRPNDWQRNVDFILK